MEEPGAENGKMNRENKNAGTAARAEIVVLAAAAALLIAGVVIYRTTKDDAGPAVTPVPEGSDEGPRDPAPGDTAPDTQVTAHPKMPLRLNLAAGASYEMKMITDQKLEQTIQGRDQSMVQKITMVKTIDVKEVNPGGAALVEITYKRIAFDQTGPAGEVHYDSARESGEVPLQAAAFEALIGESFSMKLAPDGRCDDIRGFAEMRDKMIASIPAPDEAAKEAMAAETEKFGDRIKENMKLMFEIYPDRPVAVGDSWSKERSIVTPTPMTTNTTWTLVAREKGVVSIDMTSEVTSDPDAPAIPMGPVQMKVEPVAAPHGTLAIDEKTGLIADSTISHELSGTISTTGAPGGPPKMSWPVHIEVSVRLTIELLDSGFNVRIETIEPMTAACMRHVGPYETCGETWRKLMAWARAEELLGEKTVTVGIPHDNPRITPAEKLRYDACISVADDFEPQADNIRLRRIGGGEYGVVTHRGSYETLFGTVDKLNDWLLRSDRQARISRLLLFCRNVMEFPDTNELITDVCVPLKPIR